MSDAISPISSQYFPRHGPSERSTNRAVGAAIVAGTLALGASLVPLPGDSALLDLLMPGEGISDVRDLITSVNPGQAIAGAATLELPDLLKLVGDLANADLSGLRAQSILELVRTYGLADVVNSLGLLMSDGSFRPDLTWPSPGGGGGGGGGMGIPVDVLSNLMVLLDFLLKNVPTYGGQSLTAIITTVLPALVMALDMPHLPAALPPGAQILSAFVAAPSAVVTQKVLPAIEEVSPPEPLMATVARPAIEVPIAVEPPVVPALVEPVFLPSVVVPPPLPEAEMIAPSVPEPDPVEPQAAHSTEPVVDLTPVVELTEPVVDLEPLLGGSDGEAGGVEAGTEPGGGGIDGGVGGTDGGATVPEGADAKSDEGTDGSGGGDGDSDGGASDALSRTTARVSGDSEPGISSSGGTADDSAGGGSNASDGVRSTGADGGGESSSDE
ncbi:hypothetical protein [Mycolicibacterium baixiangningiae]|uniref:hypothetical protein n=1 Tax=Mycolicibacterium baixiangningiae TaxID=2761578 RepID=UPI001866DC48|nr:hypothetical protein [Mycolicibacterium baixiangningiae]